ncbi:MAG TPA: MerR family transcriptional regulator [Nevskiaceae bacterium]|nr:MerR family transcriptional regulator [Nevskiaceae bacterium]
MRHAEERREPTSALPEIPRKRYFAIGEVSELCDVKPHVLRYWEQEFPQLKPVKRRGNRRYYQQEDVLMVRRIRGLLYDQGFTIGGARQRLKETPRLVPVTAPAAVEAPLPAPVGDASALPASESRRRREIRTLRSDLESLLKLF